MTSQVREQISVARDFSPYPAGRYEDDGDYCGQRFREGHLVPALRRAECVEVSFEGVYGCGSSFLDEAFGGLVREDGFTKEQLDRQLVISAGDDSSLADSVKLADEYIARAAGHA